MGLFDRVERKLDRVINGAFARAFKAEVQPVEIAAAMRRAMDERAAVVGKGRTMVPNCREPWAWIWMRSPWSSGHAERNSPVLL